MNLSTQIANDLLELTSQLPRVQASMTANLREAFDEYQRDMLAAVAKADIAGVSASSFRAKRALALVDSVRELTKKTYKNISEETEAELISLAETSSDNFLDVVNGASQGELLTNTLTSPQIKNLVKKSVIDGATSAEWWSKQAADTQFRFKNVVQDAVINGSGTDEIVRRIRGTRSGNFNDGFMNASYNNARALVHTSVQKVANESRLEMMADNDDVIEGIEWLSTLDGHTTQICKSLDGLVWDLNYKPVGHTQEWAGSTAHWQCRSTQVPVLKGFSDLPKKAQIEAKSVRSNMDGKPTSGDLDYNDWLRKKNIDSPRFVEATLGKEKYKLWKKHDLSMLDMVDQHNNPLTVAQLKRKFDVAQKTAKKVVSEVPFKKAVQVKKSRVTLMKKSEATKIMNQRFTEAGSDSKYILADDGLPLTRYRPSRRKRGFTSRDLQRADFGKAKTTSLNDESASMILASIIDIEQITVGYGLPRLRGLNTSVSGGAGAAMGDGVLHVSASYFNKGASKLNLAAANKKAADLTSKMESIKLELSVIREEMEALKDNLGAAAFRSAEYRAMGKAYNKKVNSFNAASKKFYEVAPETAVKGRLNNKWKVGDDLKDRPFTAGSYLATDLDQLRATVFHEMGHHVHQNYNVLDEAGYKAPPLERLLGFLFKDRRTVTPSKYAETNSKEWFAESFSMYHNGRKDLVDPVLIDLIDSLDSPEGFRAYVESL